MPAMGMRMWQWLVLGLVTVSMGWGAALADEAPAGPRRVEIRGDVRVDGSVTWSDAHYQVCGNVVLLPGGTLTVERATVELMGRYDREFIDLAKIVRGEKKLAWDAAHDIAVHETLLRASGIWS